MPILVGCSSDCPEPDGQSKLVQVAFSKAGKTTLRGFPLIQTVSLVFQVSLNLE